MRTESTALADHTQETLEQSFAWSPLPEGVQLKLDPSLGYVLNVLISERYIGSISPYTTKTGNFRWGVGAAHHGVDFDTARDAAMALYCCSVYGRMLVSS